ncbi:MAG: Zn-ribbon domain-containing OB-fold protein [Deltaproteobacteria bacterium]|nr:Zn-ribbon domain-containing OB-fold protein [Deltaproteobacteria bacterium]
MSEYQKPLPIIEFQAQKEFWDGCKKHQLLIQKCRDCGEINRRSVRMLCPNCLSGNLEFIQASGKGKIYSFSTIMAYPPQGFQDDVPYVVAIIDLEEGTRFRSNIVDCDIDALKCDMDVEVVWEDITDEYALPKFRPLKQGS